MNNFNFSKMRCKKLAYMLEDGIWNWFIIFTDHMSKLLPKHAVASGNCRNQKTNLMGGKFTEDSEPQGPPNT